MCTACDTYDDFNAHGLIAVDRDDAVCMIEDVRDPDGRMYRLEYRSTYDGLHSNAFCRFSPWGAFDDYPGGHADDTGFICISANIARDYRASGVPLNILIPRARYWCTAYSVFRETGEFPNP